MKDSHFCQFYDKSLTESCVRWSEDERGRSTRDDEVQVQVAQWTLREPVC